MSSRSYEGEVATLTRLAGFLAILVICAGCGKDDGPAPTAGGGGAAPASAAPRDPCQLLTAEDARAALGHDVKKTDPTNLSMTSMCQYMADNSESVTLQFHPAAPGDFDQYVKQSIDAFNATAQPIEGVGERAVLVGDQFVFMSKGHMYILVLGKNMPAPEKTERTRTLAAAVLGRL